MAAKKASKQKQLEQEQMKLGKFDENGDKEEFEYTVIPPDGGFGWVIAFAAMLCNLVCDGTLFAFGAMKPYIQEYFRCSDMTILMVGSVPCGVYLLVGPIVSGLANRYGCRPIIIIGSVGAAACMALSTLSPTPTIMIIIYGIFGGVFFGMVYLPSVVMVSFYFDKKRTIANGLVTAGTGIGALSYAPLTNYLMNKLGWKPAMLILAGIMLSCILFGAIMRPLRPTKVPIKREIEMQSPVKDAQRPPESPNYRKTSGETSEPLLSGSHDAARPSNTATVPSDVPEVSMAGTSSSSSPPAFTSRARTSSGVSHTSSIVDQHRVGVPIAEDASRPFYKKDALYTGSKKNLHHGSRTSLNNTNPYMSSVADISKAVKEEKKKDSAVRAFVEILAAMTDLSILKNKQILLICIGNIFSMLGYYLPIMCLISFANEDLKVPMEKASLLVTVFGIFNTLGRFSGGPIAMIPYLNVLRVHNGLLFSTGLITIIAAYSFNFFTCALYAGLCGFAIAPHMSLMPSIIYDCVGGDKFTTAFGILFLFRGFTSIIGPPAAGFVKDFTQSYSMAFAIGGAMIVIASFFHMAISFFESEAERQARENDGNQKVEVDA